MDEWISSLAFDHIRNTTYVSLCADTLTKSYSSFAVSNDRVSQPVHHNCPALRSRINLVVTIKQKIAMDDDNKNNPGQIKYFRKKGEQDNSTDIMR